MTSRLSLSILTIISMNLSPIAWVNASEFTLSEIQVPREFPSSRTQNSETANQTTLERDISWYYRVPIQKWEKAQQKAKDEEEKRLLAEEQEAEREKLRLIAEAEPSTVEYKPSLNTSEDDNALTEELMVKANELKRITQKWEREQLVEDIKDNVMSASKVISREGLPLAAAGGTAATIGFGGVWAIGAFTVLSSIPVAVPLGVAALGGGAAYLGLRLGAPGFLEKLPDKFIDFFKKKEPVPDDWLILSVN